MARGGSRRAPEAASGARSEGLPISPDELAKLFEEFSRTTLRLQDSHRQVESQVARLRDELADKNRQLERKKRLESLGLMVAGVAHEIRNPLGSMSLYLDCVRQELGGRGSASECRRLVALVEDAISHLDAIVESMLVFTSGSRPRLESCDLGLLLEEAAQLLRSELERSRSELRIAAPPAAPVVPGDPDGIRRVFVNVIKNALQAMGSGGLVEVSFANVEDDGRSRVRVGIRDHGPGIAPENLDKVFVPFFSTSDGKGGVGLGLTIVHSLMERQGGRVELENAFGGGLEAGLYFAREAATQAPGQKAEVA